MLKYMESSNEQHSLLLILINLMHPCCSPPRLHSTQAPWASADFSCCPWCWTLPYHHFPLKEQSVTSNSRCVKLSLLSRANNVHVHVHFQNISSYSFQSIFYLTKGTNGQENDFFSAKWPFCSFLLHLHIYWLTKRNYYSWFILYWYKSYCTSANLRVIFTFYTIFIQPVTCFWLRLSLLLYLWQRSV